ncbi:hypothetical protein LIER_31159 [Lithospermum erythrorhizon]|uniref:Uncharacterized protein n=1 Tax=Lithospermum erythrorhizon TaxID=34254 RepID=A0AAV3RTA6_LITER
MERSENSLVTGHVATIAGVIHGGGDSRNARKKYARREVYGVVKMQVSTEAITFTNADCQGLEMPHDDPLVIAPKIAHYTVEWMLVDTGSSTDIIYLSAFDKLNLPRSIIEPVRRPLTGFTGHSVYPLRIARLWVTMGKGLTSTTFQVQFTMVDKPDSSYKELIGRSILIAIEAIVSPVHLKLKFLTDGGIGEMSGGSETNTSVLLEIHATTKPRDSKSGDKAQKEG